jgi:hypothetical protein
MSKVENIIDDWKKASFGAKLATVAVGGILAPLVYAAYKSPIVRNKKFQKRALIAAVSGLAILGIYKARAAKPEEHAKKWDDVRERHDFAMHDHRIDSLFNAWAQKVDAYKNASIEEKAKAIDGLVDARVASNFVHDSTLWGGGITQSGKHWATPTESLGRGEGDNEAVAITKYALLIQGMKIPKDRVALLADKDGNMIVGIKAKGADFGYDFVLEADSLPPATATAIVADTVGHKAHQAGQLINIDKSKINPRFILTNNGVNRF